MSDTDTLQGAKALWHRQRIKRLVRSRLGQGTACLVRVSETVCTDPACPGPATDIRILGASLKELRITVHKPLDAVTGTDIAAAL
jgi:hypothetical protein